MKKRLLITLLCTLAAAPLFAQEPPSTEQQQALEQLRQLSAQQAQQKARLQGPSLQQSQLGAVAAPAYAQPQQATSPSFANTAANQAPQIIRNSTTQQFVQNSADDLTESAFQSVLRNEMPLTPSQIVRMKKMFNRNKLAENSPADLPPKPTARSIFVSLAPGATPPVIRLSKGFVSSLVFLDSTGSHWPIANYDLGNPEAFNIQWDKKSNTLMVQATKEYTYGNLAVRMVGLTTPVMITLVPGNKAIDYRADLRIQGYGPNASSLPIGSGLPGTENPVLMSLLDGEPPSGSFELNVSGGSAQAWQMGNTMYMRMRLSILSPGWISTMTSADGTHVYQLQKTPLLLVSDHGKVRQLKITGLR